MTVNKIPVECHLHADGSSRASMVQDEHAASQSETAGWEVCLPGKELWKRRGWNGQGTALRC
jgi:hypothetical protein